MVLAIETSPGMAPLVAQIDASAIDPGSRVAVVAFSNKARVVQEFADDREKVARAVRRLGPGRIGIGSPWRGKREVAVWAALGEACRLLPNGGEIRLLFGSEDFSPMPPEVRDCAKRVKLLAAAVRRYGAEDPERRKAQTPPTVPGRYPPVSTNRMPTPEATLRELQSMGAGEWAMPTARNTRRARG